MLFDVNQDNCVSCLACVRACPVEAVAVDGGDVRIVTEACIRCGACVPACPHDAIEVFGDFDRALQLAGDGRAVLILSVESTVHFYPRLPEQIVNACYEAGFRTVQRGVIGDELVAHEYRELWKDQDWGTMLRSTCPILVETVRHEYPELVPYLAPVRTPGAAEVAFLKKRFGPHTKIVYAGVCLAEGRDLVDAALTFQELEDLLLASGVDIASQPRHFTRVPEERRRHLSTAGGLPLPVLDEERQTSHRFRKVRGLDQLPAIARAVTLDGMDLGFVDILPCEGCLDHPLLGPKEELYRRRKLMQQTEPARSDTPVIDASIQLDVTAGFAPAPNGRGREDGELDAVIRQIGTAPGGRPWDCGACGFRTCRRFASALIRGRATFRQCPPYQERRAAEALQEAALDDLTGLVTHRVLRARLQQEMARSRRNGEPFAVLFTDLDRFKEVNDQFGHEAGNDVLVGVARSLDRVIRSSDIAARYGGDEFVVILMGTEEEGARRVAEVARRSIEQAGLDLGFPKELVAASIGVGVFDPKAAETHDALDMADRALYRAKAAGGNRVA